MEFFQSLTLDLKMLVVGIAGCVLLALFSGNRKSEKRYMIALTVLAAVSVYRFTRVPAEEEAQRSATVRPPAQATQAPQKPTPLVSTSAR